MDFGLLPVSKAVKNHKLIAALYKMCDVLPVVSGLSKYSTPDISALNKRVASATTSLSLLKEQLGSCCS